MLTLKKLSQNKVVQNFSFMTLGNVISQVLSLVTVLRITHFFAPDDYGLYTFITSQGLLLLNISDLGIQPIIVRSIARDKSNSTDLILNSLILRLLTVTFLTSIYFVYNHFFGILSIEEVLFVGLCALVNAVWTILEYAFLGHQKMFSASVIKIFYGILWFGIVWLLPQDYFSVYNLIFIFVGLNILQGIALGILLKVKRMMIGTRLSFFNSTKQILTQSWPYFSVMLIMIPVQQFYNIYLELNSNVEEIGFFNLARKLLTPVQMVLTYAVLAAFPSLSTLWIEDKDKFLKLITNGFQYFLIIGMTMAFLFNLFIKEIVIILFSPEYLPAVKVTQMQVWYTLLMSVNLTISTVFGSVNKEKLIFKLAVINGFISIPMLYYGSYYGAYGLSIAYVLSFAIMEVIVWRSFTNILKIRIKKEVICWFMIIGLFLISTFLVSYISLLIRILISILMLTAIVYYFIRNFAGDYQNE
jgi:O-antigen/teichoic acid export membrane protein